MELTIVAKEVVLVGYIVLAEMTDGQVVEVAAPWGADDLTMRELQWATESRIRERVLAYSRDRASTARYSLHQSKVERLGWDYARRGY